MPSSSDLKTDLIRVVFASGPNHLNPAMIDRFAAITPELPLYVVGEFEPHRGIWIPFHVLRRERDNRAAIQETLAGKTISAAVMMLAAGIPLDSMRRIARSLSGGALQTWDEELKPVGRAEWLAQRARANLTSPRVRKWLRRVAHPSEVELPVRARVAQLYGLMPRRRGADPQAMPGPETVPGTTIVIPSRDGRELLAAQLPELVGQLGAGEILVSDNGSSDRTAEWLAAERPAIRVIHSAAPLSFARAVNAALREARFSRTLLLNNDMIVEPGFIAALNRAFDCVPDLFCSTAQIFFPPGVRREETGKAVWRRVDPLDFPVRCDDPIPGEDLTWVLYGSGGCSLFDTAKLRTLGGVSEVYDPAYVEDLDFGYRAWKRGWPSVYCAGARVEHRHRATTSRFFMRQELDRFVEVNYLRFLTHAIGDAELFRRLWADAIRRLQRLGAVEALRSAPRPAALPPAASGRHSESEILALGNGDLAQFRGREARAGRTVLIASPYLPFPLSHGGAVRMFNLMRQAAAEWDLVLLTFSTELAPPARELLEICRDVVVVRRHGTHYRRETARPDRVEEFASECFRASLKQAVRQWRPAIVQLEFTQMAQYADACSPAKTILVEHDITFDLEEQLAALDGGSRETRQQLAKWKAYEVPAWAAVDCVVTMSGKDAGVVSGARQVASLPNGVDTVRFASCDSCEPERRRLLFIGSFAHLPNRLAVEFFLREVWPLLGEGFRLHVIAGAGPVNLKHPGVEVDGFVADVRPAYRRAEVVLAPLTASAGTNLKVLEAMAMERAVVSTPAGINGLDLNPGEDIVVASGAAEFAERIRQLCGDAKLRRRIERAARQTALGFDWAKIARAQAKLYESLADADRARL